MIAPIRHYAQARHQLISETIHGSSQVDSDRRHIFKLYKKIDKILWKKFNSWKGSSSLAENYSVGLHYYRIPVRAKTTYFPPIKVDYKYNGIVELVDLFPTLADLAGIQRIPSCYDILLNDPEGTKLCTDGRSLASIIRNDSALRYRDYYRLKNQIRKSSLLRRSSVAHLSLKSCLHDLQKGRLAVSQYPRPSLTPSIVPDSDQPRLTETIAMGYSARSLCYRYTVWVAFNATAFQPDFSIIYGQELYDHRCDIVQRLDVQNYL